MASRIQSGKAKLKEDRKKIITKKSEKEVRNVQYRDTASSRNKSDSTSVDSGTTEAVQLSSERKPENTVNVVRQSKISNLLSKQNNSNDFEVRPSTSVSYFVKQGLSFVRSETLRTLIKRVWFTLLCEALVNFLKIVGRKYFRVNRRSFLNASEVGSSNNIPVAAASNNSTVSVRVLPAKGSDGQSQVQTMTYDEFLAHVGLAISRSSREDNESNPSKDGLSKTTLKTHAPSVPSPFFGKKVNRHEYKSPNKKKLLVSKQDESLSKIPLKHGNSQTHTPASPSSFHSGQNFVGHDNEADLEQSSTNLKEFNNIGKQPSSGSGAPLLSGHKNSLESTSKNFDLPTEQEDSFKKQSDTDKVKIHKPKGLTLNSLQPSIDDKLTDLNPLLQDEPIKEILDKSQSNPNKQNVKPIIPESHGSNYKQILNSLPEVVNLKQNDKNKLDKEKHSDSPFHTSNINKETTNQFSSDKNNKVSGNKLNVHTSENNHILNVFTVTETTTSKGVTDDFDIERQESALKDISEKLSAAETLSGSVLESNTQANIGNELTKMHKSDTLEVNSINTPQDNVRKELALKNVAEDTNKTDDLKTNSEKTAKIDVKESTLKDAPEDTKLSSDSEESSNIDLKHNAEGNVLGSKLPEEHKTDNLKTNSEKPSKIDVKESTLKDAPEDTKLSTDSEESSNIVLNSNAEGNVLGSKIPEEHKYDNLETDSAKKTKINEKQSLKDAAEDTKLSTDSEESSATVLNPNAEGNVRSELPKQHLIDSLKTNSMETPNGIKIENSHPGGGNKPLTKAGSFSGTLPQANAENIVSYSMKKDSDKYKINPKAQALLFSASKGTSEHSVKDAERNYNLDSKNKNLNVEHVNKEKSDVVETSTLFEDSESAIKYVSGEEQLRNSETLASLAADADNMPNETKDTQSVISEKNGKKNKFVSTRNSEEKNDMKGKQPVLKNAAKDTKMSTNSEKPSGIAFKPSAKENDPSELQKRHIIDGLKTNSMETTNGIEIENSHPGGGNKPLTKAGSFSGTLPQANTENIVSNSMEKDSNKFKTNPKAQALLFSASKGTSEYSEEDAERNYNLDSKNKNLNVEHINKEKSDVVKTSTLFDDSESAIKYVSGEEQLRNSETLASLEADADNVPNETKDTQSVISEKNGKKNKFVSTRNSEEKNDMKGKQPVLKNAAEDTKMSTNSEKPSGIAFRPSAKENDASELQKRHIIDGLKTNSMETPNGIKIENSHPGGGNKPLTKAGSFSGTLPQSNAENIVSNSMEKDSNKFKTNPKAQELLFSASKGTTKHSEEDAERNYNLESKNKNLNDDHVIKEKPDVVKTSTLVDDSESAIKYDSDEELLRNSETLSTLASLAADVDNVPNENKKIQSVISEKNGKKNKFASKKNRLRKHK